MQNKCSAIALAAAPELLDPAKLRDVDGEPASDQSAARLAAVQEAAVYCDRNNAAGPGGLRTEWSDLTIRTGYVADVNVHPCVLDAPAAAHNTVFVFCGRTPGGSHPVSCLANIAGATRDVDVRGGAYATLDNLVVGFRPVAGEPSPVMPLAIARPSWTSEREGDSNGDGVRELLLRLKASRPVANPLLPPQPNAALLFYRQAPDGEQMAAQITAGVFPDDLRLGRGVLGPATPGRPLAVPGSQLADSGDPLAGALKDAINAIAGKKRAFPLYREVLDPDPGGGQVVVIDGFVACVVMGADFVDERLVVRVEPCYLVNHTLWTTPPDPTNPSNPERNAYLHKLRLSR
jgi:hypothetical protein